MPGVQVPQYLAGHKVLEVIGIILLTGNVGFSMPILSYNQQLCFSFVCDPRLLPDVEKLVSAARDAFAELLGRSTQAHPAIDRLRRLTMESDYPQSVQIPDGSQVEIRLMGTGDKDAVLRFARNLPQEDLLFLRVDITEESVVDDWIENLTAGRSTSLVVYDPSGLVGYATVHRNPAPWTRGCGGAQGSTSVRSTGAGASGEFSPRGSSISRAAWACASSWST